ncbi:hypothetical protein KP78_18420 [Jeotgalibacillus soli]|uniref:Uncharacterized protein n=1 Tax=Jeotgalibacillus soli TaxID=889306 RepID=A0A0C2RY58_9BACL|nr:hypothetical protein KP78_18420 [Jeotgalibacillus soli]
MIRKKSKYDLNTKCMFRKKWKTAFSHELRFRIKAWIE